MYNEMDVFPSQFCSFFLGIGFSSKTEGKQGEDFIAQQMKRLSIPKISAIATLKKIFVPPFLQILAKNLGNIPIFFFSSTYLEKQNSYLTCSSSFVYSAVGCHGVAEAAALAAAGPDACLVLKKTVFDKITFSLAGKKRRTKHIFL